ncbi:hypothetical protein GDO81_019780 [Engystomops pustulosus]|uniref:Uncharacterized protein n=1 Tax=Engystomops pustulosus TaxID=76066 RepID=A0AAV6YTC3_ENGPU|nr:hypothetical protein GDO81_019780 [Engystomops pustulosus]
MRNVAPRCEERVLGCVHWVLLDDSLLVQAQCKLMTARERRIARQAGRQALTTELRLQHHSAVQGGDTGR